MRKYKKIFSIIGKTIAISLVLLLISILASVIIFELNCIYPTATWILLFLGVIYDGYEIAKTI